MKQKPMTPDQAINNFKLFLELSPRNSYDDYRAAVREIAETCIALGIVGDTQTTQARHTKVAHVSPSQPNGKSKTGVKQTLATIEDLK